MARRRDRPPGAAIAKLVRERGISDPRVLDALSKIPRERFLPPDARAQAQADRAVPIGFDQTISQPFIVALMTLELALTGFERVLEIGTGSGYQSAVLSLMAREVYTVERHATLSLRARGILDGLGLTTLRYRIGDGTLGWLEEAPFDRILVTASAPKLSRALFSQLVEGGLLVAPFGSDNEQHLTVVRKQSGRPTARRLIPCRFVKLIGAEGWDEAPDT
jgi:protein-L-isoaspartate(D-aspartate) O-methyltransferase